MTHWLISGVWRSSNRPCLAPSRRGVLQARYPAAGVYAFLLWLACAPALSHPAPAPDAAERQPAAAEKKAEPAAPAAPVAVPLPDIPARAEAASAALRDIEGALAAGSAATAAIEKELPVLTREIDARFRETSRIVAQRPSLELLKKLDRGWRRMRAAVLAWSEEFEQRTARLERDGARVAELEKTWGETLKRARETQDAELVRRVETLMAAIGGTRAAIEKQRVHSVRVASRVTAQELRITEAVDLVREAREKTLARIFTRDSPPVWSPPQAASSGVDDRQESLSMQVAALEAYFDRRTERFVLHGAILALLVGALYAARRRSAQRAARDPELERVEQVLATPVATAMVLSLLASRWLYPQAPFLMWMAIVAAALIPTVIVLRPVVERSLRPLLYAVIAFFLIDQSRMVAASMHGIPRMIFLAEMILGTVFMLWFTRSLRLARAGRGLRFAAGAGCAVFAVSAAANALGYVSLGNLLGNALLGGAYFGLVLYAAVQILDAIVIVALRSHPFSLLGMVQRHREMLRRRARFTFATVGGVLWSLIVLERLAIRQPILDGLGRLMDASLSVGAVDISLGDVIAFGLVVWGSFIVSRLVRFLLDEDVYPRASMQRGLYYAISKTLHYVILVAGFFMGIAVLGFDMTKFTILAGAFTVGVGFGLQNIFNNFVSGLILLFERPMQVGDMIQIEDTIGIVERIGIRASVVRSASGSEIIVPNGKLISERFVNWTLSSRRRSLELPVAVAHGADPKRVIELIERVAAAHPKVLKSPRPEVLLTKLGPDWMGFELRAYTGDVEDWMRVRSELAVASSDALAAEKIAMK